MEVKKIATIVFSGMLVVSAVKAAPAINDNNIGAIPPSTAQSNPMLADASGMSGSNTSTMSGNAPAMSGTPAAPAMSGNTPSNMSGATPAMSGSSNMSGTFNNMSGTSTPMDEGATPDTATGDDY